MLRSKRPAKQLDFLNCPRRPKRFRQKSATT